MRPKIAVSLNRWACYYLRQQHNSNYVVVFLYHQTQSLDATKMLRASSHDINASRIDGTVAQNICQFRNILFDTIEGPCEQFAEIVGKNLRCFYTCYLTQSLHCGPNIASIQRSAAASDKDRSRCDLLPFRIG